MHDDPELSEFVKKIAVQSDVVLSQMLIAVGIPEDIVSDLEQCMNVLTMFNIVVLKSINQFSNATTYSLSQNGELLAYFTTLWQETRFVISKPIILKTVDYNIDPCQVN